MKKPTPLLSIITVCLNEPQLERTCETIVNQTFQEFEWIVIDGGSNEETMAVFEKYKSRMNYFVSEPDNGIFPAMNKGALRAQGIWLSFMNAGDCFVNENILSEIFASGGKIADCDVLYGDYFANDSDIIVKAPAATKNELYHKTVCQQAAFIRRTIFTLYMFVEQYKICADWDLWYRLLLSHRRFKYLDAAVARFYENGISHADPKALFKELTHIRAQYYTPEEIVLLRKEQALLVRKRMGHV